MTPWDKGHEPVISANCCSVSPDVSWVSCLPSLARADCPPVRDEAPMLSGEDIGAAASDTVCDTSLPQHQTTLTLLGTF